MGRGTSSQGPFGTPPSKIEKEANLANYFFRDSKILCLSYRTNAWSERAIPGLKGPIPGFRRSISGLKWSIPGARIHLRPDRPFSDRRKSFAGLGRSSPGLRSNVVHSSPKRVYPRPERIDSRSEIPGQSHLRHQKGLVHA